jgi:DNA-binding XRE family transcriptional regulator
MSESSPIGWEDLRASFGFTEAEEARIAAERSRLLSEVRAYRLAEIRASHGETQTAVAERMGVSQARVSAIEHGEVSRSEVDTLAAYVEALGGKLKLVADFGDSSIVIA